MGPRTDRPASTAVSHNDPKCDTGMTIPRKSAKFSMRAARISPGPLPTWPLERSLQKFFPDGVTGLWPQDPSRLHPPTSPAYDRLIFGSWSHHKYTLFTKHPKKGLGTFYRRKWPSWLGGHFIDTTRPPYDVLRNGLRDPHK
jgi:hypothetical protein